MRIIVLSLKRLSGYRLVQAISLIAIVQLVSLPALAQVQGNLDYYAPRPLVTDNQHLANVELHLPPGTDDMVKGRYETALAHAEFMLRYFPNHPKALNLLAGTCLKWGAPKCDTAADAWFKRGIALNPEISGTHVLYALYLHRRHRLDEAVAEYRRAIEVAPDSINAHYNLGLAYIELKKYDLANLEAQKSYQLGASLKGLRNLLEKAGKWNPNVTLPDTEASSAGDAKSASDAKPDQPSPQAKTPEESPVTK